MNAKIRHAQFQVKKKRRIFQVSLSLVTLNKIPYFPALKNNSHSGCGIRSARIDRQKRRSQNEIRESPPTPAGRETDSAAEETPVPSTTRI